MGAGCCRIDRPVSQFVSVREHAGTGLVATSAGFCEVRMYCNCLFSIEEAIFSSSFVLSKTEVANGLGANGGKREALTLGCEVNFSLR